MTQVVIIDSPESFDDTRMQSRLESAQVVTTQARITELHTDAEIGLLP